MALFGPQARLERCLWWAELRGWPRGASDSSKANCYDKVFGRAAAPQSGVARAAFRESFEEVKPKNDLLTVFAIGVGLFLVWKYLLKK